ncbi:MAG: hypothetical protein JO082_12105 [Mycobacterium sp.]|nr:hypothetical protein [Mycobacterium sp.]
MTFRLAFPVLWMSAIGLVTLESLTPWGATKAAADEIRPGCGTACQSAGQYGAPGGANKKLAVTIDSSGTVTPGPDGYVPVTVTCNLQVQCTGAMLLELNGWSNPGDSMSWVTGRSDLPVNAGATQTIGVHVPAAAIDYVRSNGPTPMHVIADTGSMSNLNFDLIQTLTRAELTMAAPG